VPSSTFSSKIFILKILLTFAVLAVGYSWLIKQMAVPITTGQNQYQENRLKAENYVFNRPPCSAVILGSSLSDGLKEEYFEVPVCNLAFGGGSALWGGPIVLSSLERPQVVLIETNVLVPVNQEFMASLKAEPSRSLKNASPLLRQASQPVTQLLNWLRKKIPPPVKTVDPAQAETWIQYYVQSYNQFHEKDKESFQKNLKDMEEMIRELTASGIQVIFYRMPVDPRLLQTEKLQWENEQWSVFVSRSGTTFIDLPVSAETITKDGLHLADPSLKALVPILQAAIQAKIKQ
jgi:hypothetical protein